MSMSFNRWLAIAGMVSVLFLPVALLIGETQTGYSHVSDHISTLSASGASGAWAQSTNFILFGLLIVALAWGLHRGIVEGERSALGPILLGVVGLSAGVGSAIFPEELPGAPDTIVGNVHEVASVIGFAALFAAMLFVLPRRLSQDPRWSNLAMPSRWLGAVATLLFVAFPLADREVIEVLEPRIGLIQRLFAAIVLLWLFLLSLRLFSTSRASETSRP